LTARLSPLAALPLTTDAHTLLQEVASSSPREIDRIATGAMREVARRKKKLVERDEMAPGGRDFYDECVGGAFLAGAVPAKASRKAAPPPRGGQVGGAASRPRV
jgi:hypothetical protein